MRSINKFVAIFALLVVGAFFSGCTRIGPGHVGIVVNNAGSQKGVTDFTPTYGWQFYMPGKTTVLEYPTFVQNVTWTANKSEGNPEDESITFTTKDKMMVNMDVNLAYSLLPDKVPAFYVKFRTEDLAAFTNGFMRNVARDCINDHGGKFGVEEIMGDNADFIKASRLCLQSTLDPYGVNIDQFGIIGAPRPPGSVITSINESASAKQGAITKQNELAQTQADAAKQVAQAEGNAKAHVAQADGEAKYKIAIAKAEADSNRELNSSITPQLMEWRKLEIQQQAVNKWNGQRPQVEGAGSGLLLNIAPHQN